MNTTGLYRKTIFILIAIFSSAISFAHDIEEDLRRLDAALAMTPDYDRNKEAMIASLKNLLEYPNISSEQKYTIYEQLFNENYSYSFDASLDAINKQEKIAESLGRSQLQHVLINKALLFATAGLYLEARELADTQIDTTILSKDQLVEYHYMMQRFWKDYKEYSDGKNLSGEPVPSRFSYYRDAFIAETDSTDTRHDQLIIFNLIDNGEYEKADVKNRQYLSKIDSLSHDYAIMAYYQGVIMECLGDVESRLHWLLSSSVVDIKNSVKDNASLSSAATILLATDVERSSRYIQRSIEDALFYNAKLRPWQIARLIPNIDAAYNQKQMKEKAAAKRRLAEFAVLSAILIAISMGLWLALRRKKESLAGLEDDLERTLEDCRVLEEANENLRDACERLADADMAKMDQIVVFLNMCSGYLDKLKKTLTIEQKEAEIKKYYNTFDTGFLQMYPTFVEDFNALLKPEARIERKKEDILTTELRIFALIRLGITQSSTIASLLRYSVNTIYNYRAQIKNMALSEREDFEKSVRNIGNIKF